MDTGIFAKTFVRPSLEAVLDAVQQQGLTQVQFNMSCAGLPSLPDFIDPVLARNIGDEMKKRSIRMAAVSGTFNMIHPHEAERQKGLHALRVIAASCKAMGTGVITLCTGTRNPHNMWLGHPANGDPSAWGDLLLTLEQALPIAEAYGITLAFEPEQSNVINSAAKARRLLDEIKSDNLKVVIDASNMFSPDSLPHQQQILEETFELLGGDIVIAHAKDVKITNGDLEFVAAGQGQLDFITYLKLLQDCNFSGALIMHGLEEQEVAASVDFLQQAQLKASNKKI